MIHLFENKLQLIQDDKLREFAVDALTKCFDMVEGYADMKVNYIKSVVNYVNELCDVVDADDDIRDIMIVAGLIHDLEFEYDANPQLKPLALRVHLNDLMPIIGREKFENIMYILVRQKGFQTVYTDFLPQVESPIHIWVLPVAIHFTLIE